ncbi:MAG: Gfo/Idh/MocA family oxidoreductase [Bacteroidia bacterium]
MKVALIGTSGYAGLYLQTLLCKHKNGEIVLSDIVSIHYHSESEIDSFKEKGISFHSSLVGFFSENRDIDLLCIPTSIHSHFSIAKQGLSYGYNLLLEKPAAATPDQIIELKNIANREGLNVFVGFQNLYEPETWQIKKSLVEGAIGEIKSAHFLGLWPRSEEYFKRNEWAGKLFCSEEPVFDSVIHNAFAHFVNLLFFWTGTNVELSSTAKSVKGQLMRANDIESFDTASIIVENENQIPLFVNVSHACIQNVDPRIRIKGSKGSFEWYGDYYILNGERVSIDKDANSAIQRARKLMFDNVIRCMNGFEAENCNLDLAYPVTHLVSLLHDNLDIDAASYNSNRTEHGIQRVIEGVDVEMINSFERSEL